jgi:DNA adenine methylase
MTQFVLRWPGGKTREATRLFNLLTDGGKLQGTVIEPFAGGGPVSLTAFEQGYSVWLNDLHLGPLWYTLHFYPRELVAGARYWFQRFQSEGVKSVFEQLGSQPLGHGLNEAVRLYVRNRLSFSGLTDCGGVGKGQRFTESAIQRLELWGNKLYKSDRFHSTQVDYRKMISHEVEDTLLFLDPPYENAKASNLYGTNGSLHRSYSHDDLAKSLKHCPNRWLMTTEDSPQTREVFGDYCLFPWIKPYGMAQGKIGAELLVSNFEHGGL